MTNKTTSVGDPAFESRNGPRAGALRPPDRTPEGGGLFRSGVPCARHRQAQANLSCLPVNRSSITPKCVPAGFEQTLLRRSIWIEGFGGRPEWPRSVPFCLRLAQALGTKKREYLKFPLRLSADLLLHTNSPHPPSREGHLSTARWSSSFLLSGLILNGFHAAAAACSRVHRNSVPSTQMRCMITASRRARATIAFFIPRRLAICMAQALSQDHFFECIMLCAAS